VPRQPKKQTSPRITEAHVQKAVTDLLVLDGWRAIRTDPVSDRGRGKGFGELGMPDYLYVRYINPTSHKRLFGMTEAEVRSEWDGMWVEFKAPNKTPEPHQRIWHARELARGALVLVVDSIDSFMDWYRQSGLARKVLQDGQKSKDRR